MNLSPKFEQALQYAASIHSTQKRKGTDIPYVSHLLGVASIALEHGANEDEAIGALLHDAGEDAGGQTRIDDIHRIIRRRKVFCAGSRAGIDDHGGRSYICAPIRSRNRHSIYACSVNAGKTDGRLSNIGAEAIGS